MFIFSGYHPMLTSLEMSKRTRLAREGCSLLTTSSPAITYSEHQSKVNRQLSKEWKIPPSHHWYAARKPGSFLYLNCDRASKTANSRLASGHTKSLSLL
ncbi:hypothetical protein TNCV_2751901 [Trichonephila clavipes]|nr:hypothetical protein TNCV_2751901 [Trichonephila clavipes]